MLNVFVTARSFGIYDKEAIKLLEDNGIQVERSPIEGPLSESEILSLVEGRSIDALLVGADEITAQVIKNVKDLKVVSMHGSGLDRIDIKSAEEMGVEVTSAAGLNAIAVAELAIGLLLCLARKIPMANSSTKSGKWEKIIGNSLANKTLGLVGLGDIGKKVASLAHGFEMNIIAHDLYVQKAAEYITMVELDECLVNSDYLSLHVPLVDGTKNLINKDKLKLMKPEACLINTSRGGIINENDLYESLKNREIAGAALDVLAIEPIDQNHPLSYLDNCILTPHIGGRTEEVVKAVSCKAAQNIIDVLKRHN